MPRAMLREAGLDPDRDLDTRLVGSHRDVAEAVIAGEVDAGAMHENWLAPPTLERGHEYARIRVVARSREIPRGPVVVRSTLDPELRRRFLAAMLSIHEADPEAARILLSDGRGWRRTPTGFRYRSHSGPIRNVMLKTTAKKSTIMASLVPTSGSPLPAGAPPCAPLPPVPTRLSSYTEQPAASRSAPSPRNSLPRCCTRPAYQDPPPDRRPQRPRGSYPRLGPSHRSTSASVIPFRAA